MAGSWDGLVEPEEKTLTYDRYLKVHELLSLQNELSEPKEHDETLFILIHQVYELWFKQILHELARCRASLAKDQLVPMVRSLRRVDKIQKLLVDQVDILETMAPNEFNSFRNRLNPASGFQSHQFRLLEFELGLKDERYLRFFSHDPSVSEQLESALKKPSLYQEFLAYLHRQGWTISQDAMVAKRVSSELVGEGLVEVFKKIYENSDDHYEIYLACEAFIDLDEQLILWRSRHVMMVERMIGAMPGTGGSKGAAYLQQTLSKRAFPELWQVRNFLGSL